MDTLFPLCDHPNPMCNSMDGLTMAIDGGWNVGHNCLLMVAGMLGTIALLVINLKDYSDDVVQTKRFVLCGIAGAAQVTLFLVLSWSSSAWSMLQRLIPEINI